MSCVFSFTILFSIFHCLSLLFYSIMLLTFLLIIKYCFCHFNLVGAFAVWNSAVESCAPPLSLSYLLYFQLFYLFLHLLHYLVFSIFPFCINWWSITSLNLFLRLVFTSFIFFSCDFFNFFLFSAAVLYYFIWKSHTIWINYLTQHRKQFILLFEWFLHFVFSENLVKIYPRLSVLRESLLLKSSFITN